MNAVLRLISRRGEPSRRTRRVLVGLGVIAILAIGVTMSLRPVDRDWGIPLVLLSAILALAPLYAVTEFRRNVLRRTDADERELAQRNEAYRISYRVVEVGLVTVPLFFAFADWLETLPIWDWFGVWFAAWGLAAFLPYLVFAWREPDGVTD